jgi:hypothetical protein
MNREYECRKEKRNEKLMDAHLKNERGGGIRNGLDGICIIDENNNNNNNNMQGCGMTK